MRHLAIRFVQDMLTAAAVLVLLSLALVGYDHVLTLGGWR